MFKLEIDTDGAAFDYDNELARIVRGVARTLEEMPARRTGGVLRDINGNACGQWEFIPSDELD